jgi:ER membrane protein complex subunit 2
VPDTATVERLAELATTKLAEIVRRSSAGDYYWRGYGEAEIAAARELLEEGADKIVK